PLRHLPLIRRDSNLLARPQVPQLLLAVQVQDDRRPVHARARLARVLPHDLPPELRLPQILVLRQLGLADEVAVAETALAGSRREVKRVLLRLVREAPIEPAQPLAVVRDL